MRIILVLLSIALIFVGIVAIMYVDFNTHEESKKETKIAESDVETGSQYGRRTTQTTSGSFERRATMDEIDSITASLNYNFTIDNAVIDRPKEEEKTKQTSL